MQFVLNGGLANGSFEKEHVVRQRQRIAMQEIDFELRRAHFLRQRVDSDALLLAERINVVDIRIKVVHLIDAVWLTGCIRATQPAFRGPNFNIGVSVRIDQIELDLGGDDRCPTLRLV